MNFDIIEQRLARLKKKWPNKKTILFRHRLLIDKKSTYILEKSLDKRDLIYMRFPTNNKIFIGYDNAIKYISKNNLTQFSIKRYHIKSNIKADKIKIFGGSAFSINSSNNFPWNNIPQIQFTIPKFLFSFDKSKKYFIYSSFITKHFKVKTILNEIKNCINDLNFQSINNTNQITLTSKVLIPNELDYLKKIDLIKKNILQKKIKKVVLSRIEQYNISNIEGISTIINNINNAYPNCFNFLIKFNNEDYFFGSTPEKIITKKHLSYQTTAIAGSSKNIDLLNDKKEIEEHNYVIEYLKHVLKKHSNKITIEKTRILDLKYIKHLQTNIKGKTFLNVHILELLKKIYPTPALSGFPNKKALRIINKIENFNRGWYAGALGTYNSEGDGEFYVPIRSALIRKNKIFLYSGGGIVEKSNAEKEWQETTLKFKHLKNILK